MENGLEEGKKWNRDFQLRQTAHTRIGRYNKNIHITTHILFFLSFFSLTHSIYFFAYDILVVDVCVCVYVEF